MLKYLSYSDEIVLYWNKRNENILWYEIFLNGVKIGETTNTFYRIKNLLPNKLYNLTINSLSKDREIILKEQKTYKTKHKKEDIVITSSPYNAIGDSKTLNTSAIQQAIDDCDKYHRVVIPKGVFLTGALRLHSNTELYIEKGATLLGSTKKEDYLPMINSRFEGWESKSYSSLINIGYLDHDNRFTTKNIVIRGNGKIVGGGEELLFNTLDINGKDAQEKRDKLTIYQENLSSDTENKHRTRGRLINITNSENVIIDGLELSNSPSWNVHILYSKNVTTLSSKIISKGIWNGDGWNPDSSTNCTIFDTTFDTGDDSIAIKSGKNPEGNIINIPSKNINIFSCFINKGKSHGVSIGSEVSGGIENIKIWDSDFSNSFFGLHIKTTKKRGGYINNLKVLDSKISRILIREVDYNDDGESSNELTSISNLSFKNIKIEYNSGDANYKKEADSYIYINGFNLDNNKSNNIKFRNLTINNKEKLKDYNIKNCSNVSINNKKII